MSQSPIICPRASLPRDLDVSISISRPQSEVATDMTLLCFLTPGAPFAPDNGRVRYYSTFDSFVSDFAVGTAAYFAGQAFFSRSERPVTMAVGRVCVDPVAAGLLSTDVRLGALRSVSDGAFDLEVNGALVSARGLKFTSVSTLAAAAAVLQSALGTSGVNVSCKYGGLVLETVVRGQGATLDYAATPGSGSGTDVCALLGLSKEAGARLWQGYTPEGLAAEAELARAASRCNLRPVYGWAIDAVYRDTDEQKAMADWVEGLTPAYFSACTNSAAAYNAQNETNIGAYCYSKGYKRTSVIYHDNAQVYPDVSYLALALATNYSLPDSAITMKFKQLDGIEPSPLSESMLSVLNSRRINCYVYIGNTARTVREGVQALDTWFTDSLVNLDNFREELQVEIYNVFLRSPKIPYTVAGQNKLISAAAKICNKYTRNGVFAPRDVEASVESGFQTLPATNITPVHVAYATASERASRTAPPIKIIAYEAGAFHKVSVSVDVYN